MANRLNYVGRDDDALFVENGVPVKFCFHTSITQGRNAITRDVQQHGGQTVSSERDANVLLIDEQQDLAYFRSRYYHSTELYRLALYVEPRGFVQRCIRAGVYTHDRPVKQGMPGMAPGERTRVAFTEKDRDDLAHYLATKLPTRDGRLGNKAYQQLQQLGRGDDPTWAWAKRHTWHSWREHYKRNRAIMDVLISAHVERLKNVGHHLGHDPRRHRREEEEEEIDSEEERQRQRMVRQNHRRREQGRPAPARGRGQAARGYLARHEPDLVPFDNEGEGGEGEPQRLGRPRVRPDANPRPDPKNIQRRRARVLVAPSDEGRYEEDDNSQESDEIIGSDLFGDRLFEDGSEDEVPQAQPFSPRASPVLERDGAPPSTQATLIAQSPLAEKERPFASSPTRAVETSAFREAAPEQAFPQSSQQTMVAVQQLAEQRFRVGGAAVVDGPNRNISYSVEPEPLGRESPKGKGKGKAKEVLAPIADNFHEEEGEGEFLEEEVGLVLNTDDRPSRQETLRDEESVEELLDPSDEEVDLGLDIPRQQDVIMEQSGSQEDNELNDDESEIAPQIEARHQDVDMGQPSDSDDAETHGSLIRGTAGEHGQGDSASEKEQDEGAERMERTSLPAHTPTPPQPRVTRSMAAAAAAQRKW